jgi:hypothetical protein
MTQMIEVYRSASSATPTPRIDLTHERPTEAALLFVVGLSAFAGLFAATSSRFSEPYVSEELAAEIRSALAAAERGETEDLGSFAQYADEPDDED